MNRNLGAPIVTLIAMAIFYSIAEQWRGYPMDEAWFNWWTRSGLFVALTMFVRHLWVAIPQGIGNVPKGGSESRMIFDRDIREAFATRARNTGDNLIQAAARLRDRNLPDLSDKAQRMREQLLALGSELDSQIAAPNRKSTGAGFSARRAGEIVKFDKQLLALMEEMSDGAVEFTSIAVTATNNDDLVSRLNHFDETTRRLKELIQERHEMVKGIR